jgi:hypothetical protein
MLTVRPRAAHAFQRGAHRARRLRGGRNVPEHNDAPRNLAALLSFSLCGSVSHARPEWLPTCGAMSSGGLLLRLAALGAAQLFAREFFVKGLATGNADLAAFVFSAHALIVASRASPWQKSFKPDAFSAPRDAFSAARDAACDAPSCMVGTCRSSTSCCGT